MWPTEPNNRDNAAAIWAAGDREPEVLKLSNLRALGTFGLAVKLTAVGITFPTFTHR
jgi:hypothetical protein